MKVAIAINASNRENFLRMLEGLVDYATFNLGYEVTVGELHEWYGKPYVRAN